MTDHRPFLVALLLSIGVLGIACGGRYCEDPYITIHGCGLNHRGTQRQTCTDGEWQAPSACLDPDVCVDGTKESIAPAACGLNGRGTSSTRTCTNGQWIADCADPDVCVDGAGEYQLCNALGRQSRQCSAGQWGAYGACDDLSSLAIEAPGLFSGGNTRAFVEGRMRVSRDGALLFVTMGNGVAAYPTGR